MLLLEVFPEATWKDPIPTRHHDAENFSAGIRVPLPAVSRTVGLQVDHSDFLT